MGFRLTVADLKNQKNYILHLKFLQEKLISIFSQVTKILLLIKFMGHNFNVLEHIEQFFYMILKNSKKKSPGLC